MLTMSVSLIYIVPHPVYTIINNPVMVQGLGWIFIYDQYVNITIDGRFIAWCGVKEG